MALLVAMFLAYALPGIGEVETRPHALYRHGADAIVAREANMGNDPGQRYDCPDGRTRIIKRIGQNKWAITVLDGNIEVTSFVASNKNHVDQMIDECEAPARRRLHP